MQPKHPNNNLKNGHVWVAGMSGSGKTYLTKKLLIAKQGHFIGFDAYGDYGELIGSIKPVTFERFDAFKKAVMMARNKRGSFAYFWTPTKPAGQRTNWEDLQKFCEFVWALGDGRHPIPLKVICEELAAHSRTNQSTCDAHELLLLAGRKYHIHTINIFQRGQDVSKLVIEQCDTCYIMKQKTKKTAKYLEELTGVPAKDIDNIESLQYIEQYQKDYKKASL